MDQNENAGQSSRSDRGTIRGQVVDRHRHPLEGAVVMIVGDSPSHRDIAALTSDRGEFSFIGLLPGKYTLLVNVADCEAQEASVEVLAGGAGRLNFVIK